MGRFILERRRHVCPLPGVDATLDYGSLWECECGLIWKLSHSDGQWWGRAWQLPYFQTHYRQLAGR